jgi:hypothetical protein
MFKYNTRLYKNTMTPLRCQKEFSKSHSMTNSFLKDFGYKLLGGN